MSETYSVVLTGKLLNGESLNDVKTSVGSAFKLSAAQLDKLFSGKPVALKRGLDKKQAVKLSTRLQQLGAHAVIKLAAAKPAPASAASAPAPKAVEPAVKTVAKPVAAEPTPEVPFTDIVADMSEPKKAAKEKLEPVAKPTVKVAEPDVMDAPVVEAVAKVAPKKGDKEGITCPRCGHEQAFTTACGHCKMDLSMHIMRLERRAKVLANRS